MFEARLEQGVVLKKIVEAIKDLVKNVNIDANESGMSMQAMDSSHVALVSFQLNESGFSQYRCDRPITLGIAIEHLSKVLKCANNEDVITLSAEEEPSQLKLTFESPKQDKVSEFSVNLLNLDQETLAIPKTEYASIVTLGSGEFARICRELGQLSDTITIETNKEYVKFSVNGEVGQGSTSLKRNDSEKPEDQTILEVDEPITLSFALRYLNLFNKASNLCQQVTLCLSNDQPFQVEFKIIQEQKENGALKFYLAPKINDEEGQTAQE